MVMPSRHEHEGPQQHFATDRYHGARHGLRDRFKPSSRRLSRRGVNWHRRYLASGDVKQLDHALRDLSEAVWDRAPYVGNVKTDGRHWAEFANNFGVAL